MSHLQDLTAAEKTALSLGRRKGGVHVGTGRTADGEDAPLKRVTKPVAARLVHRGLAVKHGVTLLTTTLGKAELAKPVPHKAVFMRLRDGLTTNKALAVPDEDEVQDTADLDPQWADDALRRHTASKAAKRIAREAAQRARRAA